ncbi:hypothetical protein DE146DRAFT_761547 [Phaeosphaeria sp. MPI-PUGE-AT-0046c]|nr:hypothetical protein DE146DRAFT_761547 [Phaeosphaeria sp. MPI-PUGE-AT-0046c]
MTMEVDAPAPSSELLNEQNPPSAPLPTGAPSSSAATAPKKKRVRAPSATQVLQNKALLAKVTWSKECRPSDDLSALIEAGRAHLAEFDRSKSDWEAAGKPLCEACSKTHPPPCMTYEDMSFLRAQRTLLKAYESEERAAQAALTSTEGSSESKGKGKGKDKIRAPPVPEKDTADADAKQSSSNAKGKSNKSNKRCEKCGEYHSTECWLKEPCKMCSKWHKPNVACPFTDNDRAVWGSAFASISNTSAAAVFGQMLNDRFAPARAGPSGGGGTKRKRPKDFEEKSDESKKK